MLQQVADNLQLGQRVPTLYSYFYQKLSDAADDNTQHLSRDQAAKVLYINGVPKYCHAVVFQEMERYGLVRLNQRKVFII